EAEPRLLDEQAAAHGLLERLDERLLAPGRRTAHGVEPEVRPHHRRQLEPLGRAGREPRESLVDHLPDGRRDAECDRPVRQLHTVRAELEGARADELAPQLRDQAYGYAR